MFCFDIYIPRQCLLISLLELLLIPFFRGSNLQWVLILASFQQMAQETIDGTFTQNTKRSGFHLNT
jgi:hypothetical protein